RIVILSGSVYAELTYTVLSLAALWLSDRYLNGGAHRLGIAAGTFFGFGFFTRTAGPTLLGATAGWFFVQRPYIRLTVVVSISGLLIAPWLLWRHAHQAPITTAAAAYYTDYLADFRTMVVNPQWLPKIVKTNFFYLTIIFMPLVSLSLDYWQWPS